MRNLGGCYSTGNGVDKDKDEALKWYKKAAFAGDEASIKYLQKIGEYETPESQYKETPMLLEADTVTVDSIVVEDEVVIDSVVVDYIISDPSVADTVYTESPSY